MRIALPQRASYLVAPLYEFLFTPVCCHCDRSLVSGERFVCRQCCDALLLVDLRDPIYKEAHRRLTEDGTCDQLISLFRFEKESPLQSMLHELKYRGRMGIGLLLGSRLGALVASLTELSELSGCLPVPLHRVRKRERGFNQSALLCRGIAAATGVRVQGSFVRRVRPTLSQTTLGVDERKTNVEGAFALTHHARGKVAGRSFLLVDDVLTTGATIRACAAALKCEGARRVVACTVALAA